MPRANPNSKDIEFPIRFLKIKEQEVPRFTVHLIRINLDGVDLTAPADNVKHLNHRKSPLGIDGCVFDSQIADGLDLFRDIRVRYPQHVLYDCTIFNQLLLSELRSCGVTEHGIRHTTQEHCCQNRCSYLTQAITCASFTMSVLSSL